MKDSELSDETLVRLSIKEEKYYLCLMKRYEAKLSRYIRRLIICSDEDVEDILQEVFIKVYKSLNSFDPKQKFSSWIYRITHNEVISLHRKTKARPSVISFDKDFDIFQFLPASTNLEREVEKTINNREVHTILEKLKPKYKDVLILRYLEEKNYNEISYILRKPKGTVATLINRAKKIFKDEAVKHLGL